MKNFEHVNAATAESAVSLLEPGGHTAAIAGGTDLLTRMRTGITEPERIVNLKTIPGLKDITYDEAGMDIGALVTLDYIAGNAVVRESYTALAEAINVAASPQLRNMGTIGGNLMQSQRCWYYRGQFKCWFKGGDTCYALKGDNRYHAIFATGLCHLVHPSDPATALIALGAEVNILGPTGERRMPLEDMFQLPCEDSRQLTALNPDEIITKIHLPRYEGGYKSTYRKAMERKVWSFALAAVAVNLRLEGGVVKEARLVLGGVAPKPWRVPPVEAELTDKRLDNEIIIRAAELAVAGAHPLSQNRYKIALVKGLVKEALAAFVST